jgi:hypothetical protein
MGPYSLPCLRDNVAPVVFQLPAKGNESQLVLGSDLPTLRPLSLGDAMRAANALQINTTVHQMKARRGADGPRPRCSVNGSHSTL